MCLEGELFLNSGREVQLCGYRDGGTDDSW